jgi:hypothetical protein
MPDFIGECPDCELNVDVKVTVDEILDGMSDTECEEMLNGLAEMGYTIPSVGRGYLAEEFADSLHKLATNYHALTSTETDIIITLAKRF